MSFSLSFIRGQQLLEPGHTNPDVNTPNVECKHTLMLSITLAFGFVGQCNGPNKVGCFVWRMRTVWDTLSNCRQVEGLYCPCVSVTFLKE